MSTAVSSSAASSANPRFVGKVVVITGATSGIGAAAASAFAMQGAKVFFCGRREALGRQVEATIRAAGGEATYRLADVRDPGQVKQFIADAITTYGAIDIAFNNAGIAIPPSTIEAVAADAFQDILATNLSGVFWSMQAEVAQMKQNQRGVIINTCSVFGDRAADNQVPYGATRSDVHAMTKAVAKEVGKSGIRVVAVSPGAIVDTDLFRFVGRAWNDQELGLLWHAARPRPRRQVRRDREGGAVPGL